MTFWLSVILALLPSGGSQPDSRAQVSVGEAISAAKATVGDLRQFCDRQPDACTIGSSAAVTLGHRAQAGAKAIYELLTERLGPNETGSMSTGVPGALTAPSRDTLTPSDLAPLWRGPQPHRR
jgi:Family of unknown function (DUF5330)